MTITPIQDNTEAKQAITTFAMTYGAKLPADFPAKLVAAASEISPVVAICDTIELLYACRAAITDAPTKAAAQTLIAQIVPLATTSGWHKLRDKISTDAGAPSRGAGMNAAVLRELGEPNPMGGSWPTADQDPEPDPRFVEAPTGAPVPAPAPAPAAQTTATTGQAA